MGDDFDQASGDGGSAAVSEADLKMLQDELEAVWNDAGTGVWSRRGSSDDARFCRWDGQSADGKKRRAALGEVEPFPFEGASDARVRLADGVTNFLVAVVVTSALRAMVRVRGIQSLDEPEARRAEMLLQWILANQLGAAWPRELQKVAHYMIGDSPGVGIMGVYWEQQTALRNAPLAIEDVPDRLAELMGGEPTPEELTAAGELLTDPGRQADAVRLLRQLIPQLTATRAREILKAWQEGRVAQFPEAYIYRNLPRIQAHRLMEDIIIASNTAELQRARVIFRRQWLTRVEVREREVSEGWDPEFITEVVGDGATKQGHEGETAFPEIDIESVHGDYSLAVNFQDKESRRGHYEILTAYWRAIRDDGVPGIYVLPFHHAVKRAAKKRELLNYAHGLYPFVDFARERITSYLMDSRGASEICMTDQEGLKLLTDTYFDHAQLSTVPPIEVPLSMADTPLTIRPLGQIPRMRHGDVNWMQPPQYPVSNLDHQKEIRRRVAWYFGLPDPDVPPEMGNILLQLLTTGFLESCKQVEVMVLLLCQQFLPQPTIERIVGRGGLWAGRGIEEIQGQFDLYLSYDVRDLSMEHLSEKGKTIREMIVPLDRRGVIQTEQVAAYLMHSLDPNLAEATVLPAERADQREVDDEKKNFALIAAGVEPTMQEEGQNFPLRLQTLEQIMTLNPAAVNKMDETSGRILEKRLEHLRFQTQQIENAEVGRVGAKPALGPGGGK